MSKLEEGSALVVEDLDLSGMGLYLESQVDLKDPDVVLSGYLSFGRPLYYKKSDEGKKRFTYEVKNLKIPGGK